MTKLEHLKLEYDGLRKVYFELRGDLYPSIVYKSLQEVVQEYVENGGSSTTLEYTPPPDYNGYAPTGPIL